MGSEIASLYAKLGLDSSQFQKGLTDSKTKLSGFGGKLGEVTKGLTGFSLGSLTAAGAVVGVINQVRKAVDETVAYNSSIKDTARLLGMSTEETSRLVQAADDLFLSEDKLKTAMQAASRQGIDVSITGLKKLSDKYLALNPGVERAQFLMQSFGRSGADMYKLMEVGAAGIDKAMAAVENSLVVTDKSIKATDEYKRNLDKLADAWMGVKIAVGNGVIPVLNAFLSTEKDAMQIELQNIETQRAAIEQAIGRNIAVEENRAKLILLGESENAIREAIAATTEETNRSSGAYLTAAESLQKYSAQLLYNAAIQGLDEKSALQLAYSMGLVDTATVTALTKQAEFKQMLDDGSISLTTYQNLVTGTANAIASMQSKNITVTVDTYENYHGSNNGSGNGGRGITQTPHASGGSFLIPMSYGYEGFQMGNGDTASGGERVDITPRGKEPGGQITLTDEQLGRIGKAAGRETAITLMQYGYMR